MQKKKLISIVSLFSITLLCLNLTPYKTTGSHPGSTGAPLDQTCAASNCHTDAQVIFNAVNNTTLTFSSADTTYIPGQTYTLTLKAKGNPLVPTAKFGFELVALTDKDSLNAGSFSLSDGLRTQLISHAQGSDFRISVTHQTNGTPALATNYTQWSFNWTAPQVNEGNVSFYYAANCTNDDGTEFGDNIYLSSLRVRASITSSIKEIADEYELKTYFDAESKTIQLSYDLKGEREVQISVFDSSGKLVYSQASTKQTNKQSQKIVLGDQFPKGTYLVQLLIKNQTVSKKVLVS